MTVDRSKDTTREFVKGGRNEVLQIHGDWGVGKTHFWHNTISELSKTDQVKLTSYSYVSVFGVESIESLKSMILASKISTSAIGKGFNQSASQLYSKAKKLFRVFERNSTVRAYTSGWANELFFNSVRDCLVCFDDLERISEKVAIGDLIGIISMLKDQRNCQIVIILNKDSFSADHLKLFNRHSEKLVDFQLSYSPSPIEAFNIVFDHPAIPYYEEIKSYCLKLEIKNLRNLKRIKVFVEKLVSEITLLEEPLQEKTIRSVILLVWCYYTESVAPSFHFLNEFAGVKRYIKEKNQENVSKTEEGFYDLLEIYGHDHTEDIDKHLMRFIERGYLDDELHAQFQEDNRKAIAQRGKDTYKEAWSIYEHSLYIEDGTFIQNLKKGFPENLEYLSLMNLNETVNLLVELGHTKSANTLIDGFVAKRVSYEEYQNFKDHIDFKKLDYPYLLDKLEAIPRPKRIYDFQEVIVKINSNSTVSVDELAFLADCDDSKYFEVFMSNKIPHYVIAKILEFEITPKSSNPRARIREKTEKSLRKIALKSKTSKHKISSWYGFN